MNLSADRRLIPYSVTVAAVAIALCLTRLLEPWMSQLSDSLVYSDALRLGSFALVVFAINWLSGNVLSRNVQTSTPLVENPNRQQQDEKPEQLRMALEAARMGLWDWNILTGEIIWSPEHAVLFGLAPGAFDGKYETFDAYLHPDDRDRLNQVVQQALEERHTYQHEYRVVWTDGSIHWVEGRGQGVYDEAGQPVRMTGTIMNIDSRKRLEQERERLAVILEASPDFVGVLDTHGKTLWLNSAAKQLIGYASDDDVSHLVISDYHPQWAAEMIQQRAIPAALQNGSWLGETALRHRGGSEIAVSQLIIAHQVADGRVDYFSTIMRDCRDRKQAEEAVRLSEERYRSLVEATAHSVWVIDANGCTVSVASTWIESTGQMPEVGAAWDWLEAVHPDDRDRVRQTFTHCLETGELYEIEYRLRSQSGDYRLFLVKGAPVFNADGSIREWVGTLNDITDRKLAEAQIRQLNTELEERVAERTAELRTSQARFAGILEIASDAIISIDAEQRITLFNQGAETIFGYSAKDVIGQPLSILLPERFAKTHDRQVRGFAHSDGAARLMGERGEILGRRKDGSEFPAEASISRLELGNERIVSAILRDISDRKQVEATQAQLAAIIASSEDAIISKTLDGIVLSWNASAERLFGYSAEEMIGKSVKQIIPDDRLSEEARFLRQIRQGSSIQHYETIRRHKDGTLIEISLTLSPVKDAAGNTVGASKIARDITKQRQLDRMKSEFISIVSHELRTPLTAIRGSLGLIMRGVYDQKPEKKHRMIEIASQQSDRLVRLVNDILDLQRLESGRVKLTLQTCNAADLIQQSVDTMRASAEEHQIQLIAMPQQILVWANADAIIQTLTNLLSNAIKFSEPGSKIWLDAEVLRIARARKVTGEEDDEESSVNSSSLSLPHALFSIKDQGRGIPADKLETIFERFHQVDASDSREKGGTGLGLAICRRIIVQHEGQIWAESVLGEGSTFYFTLPLSQEESGEDRG